MNKGFKIEEIDKVRSECKRKGNNFVANQADETEPGLVSFFFVGKYEGKDVVYDACLYTLELHYITALSEKAETMVKEKRPEFANADFDAFEGEHVYLFDEFFQELAEDDQYKVQEFIELDPDAEYGVRLDAALHVSEINAEIISRFVGEFNDGKLQLDDTLYSFELDDEV